MPAIKAQCWFLLQALFSFFYCFIKCHQLKTRQINQPINKHMKINGIDFKEVNVKVTAVEIGPEQAQVAVANMAVNQRKPSQRRINEYAKEMAAGKWKVSNDAAIICGDKWLNANHRMLAILKSGTKQTFLLLQTDDESVMRIVDGGKPRSVSDVMRMDSGIPSAVQFSAIGYLLLSYDRGFLSTAGSNTIQVQTISDKRLVTRQDKIDFNLKHRHLIQEAIDFVSPLYKRYRITTLTLAACTYIIIKRRDGTEAACRFIDGLFSGDNITKAQSALRSFLIRNERVNRKAPAIILFGLILKSYISHRNGTAPTVLSLKPSEEFPVI
jgi:hypothetical protein